MADLSGIQFSSIMSHVPGSIPMDVMEGLANLPAPHIRRETDANPLQDSETMREILNQEIDWWLNTVTPTAIARRYDIPEGSKIHIKNEWRKYKHRKPIKFPMAAYTRQAAQYNPAVTEGGFRLAIANSIMGCVADHRNRQPNGVWFPVALELKTATDKDMSSVVVQDGTVARGSKVGQEVYITEGMDGNTGVMQHFGVDPNAKPSIRPNDRRLFVIYATLVDISGERDIRYRNGIPESLELQAMSASQEASQNTAENLNRLINLLSMAQQKPQTHPEPKDPEDALKIAAEMLGISTDELRAISKARTGKDPVAHTADDGKYWKCTVCGNPINGKVKVAVSNHIRKHIIAGEISEADEGIHMRGYMAWYTENMDSKK